MQIIILYGSNKLTIKAESIRAALFQSQTTRSTKTLSSIQSTLNSLQNGRRSFIFRAVFVQTTTLYILRHKNVSLLQSVFTSIFYPYLFTNSSITLTLPSSIPHHFFTFLFLRTTIPTIYTKSVFPILAIYLILVLSRDQGARTSCED